MSNVKPCFTRLSSRSRLITVMVPTAPFSRSRRVRAAAVLAAGVVPADGAVVPGGGA